MKASRYDLAVIGGGSVGLIAADFARKLGARVVLLERDRIGGDCTWTGCVPSKSLLRVAKAAHEMRAAARFGLAPHEPAVEMGRVRDYLRSTIDTIYAGTTPEALRQKGIEVMFGAASFTDAHQLRVGDNNISATKVIIGTGAQPMRPDVAGLDDVPFFTYLSIFDNDQLPKRLAVIGGGPIGVEIAQAYQRLGAQVTMFADRLLPKEEPEGEEIVRGVLQREGVRIVGERARSVARSGDAVMVRSLNEQVMCEKLLVAAGRRPTLEGLNLEAAGIRYSERGIEVNDRLQTSAKHIYAAGDVLGGPQFSHLAGWQGFQAARNALLLGGASGLHPVIPRVTFCDPEVAQAGETEAEARSASGRDIVVRSWPITREDRAVCDDDRDGLLKIITTREGTIRGATIVAHRAGEAIVELALAMQYKLKISGLAGTIHPYPTYASGVQLLLSELAVDRALSSFSGNLIRAVSRIAHHRRQ
jgi:pyruvate/2-oxoglutarate dehydrogenase complex dihydrolipoamide dehydrogenase (E3) component